MAFTREPFARPVVAAAAVVASLGGLPRPRRETGFSDVGTAAATVWPFSFVLSSTVSRLAEGFLAGRPRLRGGAASSATTEAARLRDDFGFSTVTGGGTDFMRVDAREAGLGAIF